MAMAVVCQPAIAQDGAKPALAASVATGDAAKLAKGMDIFTNYGCGSCHSLAAAGASGDVGPSLDGDPNLTHDLVVDRVTNGGGPMPAFGGQMTPAEIDAIATYVVHFAKK
jgi:mono/diheme cytochrome c family protein